MKGKNAHLETFRKVLQRPVSLYWLSLRNVVRWWLQLTYGTLHDASMIDWFGKLDRKVDKHVIQGQSELFWLFFRILHKYCLPVRLFETCYVRKLYIADAYTTRICLNEYESTCSTYVSLMLLIYMIPSNQIYIDLSFFSLLTYLHWTKWNDGHFLHELNISKFENL